MDLSSDRPQSIWNKNIVGWIPLLSVSDEYFYEYFNHQLEYLQIELESGKILFTNGTNGSKCALQGPFFGQEDKLEIIRQKLESFVLKIEQDKKNEKEAKFNKLKKTIFLAVQLLHKEGIPIECVLIPRCNFEGNYFYGLLIKYHEDKNNIIVLSSKKYGRFISLEIK